MKELPDAQIAVIGLGLMGGSLAGALRGQCRTIVGVARRAATLETARDRKLIDWGTTDLPGGLHGADVVVLATPVRVILRLLDEIGSLLPEGCLLMDVGSTKLQIVSAMERLPHHVQPLGGHPMCGKETAGITAADPALYQGRTFALTPLPRTPEEALALGRALVEAAGAHPLVLEAGRHDRLAATISHLPYLLSCALVGTTEHVATEDPTVWKLAASGYHDTTRLAASDVTMMLDVLLTNREAVIQALDTCEFQLHHLKRLVEAGDEEGLLTALSAIHDRRIRPGSGPN